MKGLETDGMEAVELADDLSVCRFVFRQHGRSFWVSLPSDNLLAMLPGILNTANAIRDPDEPVAITASNVAVDLDEAGDCLLTIEDTGDAETTYLLPKEQLLALSALLESALSSQSGSTGAH